LRYELLAPGCWATWAGLACLRCVHSLPHALMLQIGRLLGRFVRRLPLKYVRTARRNVELCLPELSADEREQLVARHFECLGMGLCEAAMSWWSSDEHIRSLSQVEGCEHLDAAREKGRGVILLTAHFTTIEIGARVLNAHRAICAMYKPLKNPVLAAVASSSRRRRARAAIRSDDVRSMVRALKNGEAVFYAPDQSFRKKGAQMVHFFGIPAATNTGASRLARMTGATVLYMTHERLPFAAGYRVVVQPPATSVPSDDAVADTEHFNRFIEAEVRRIPEQYWWIHRRFKGLSAEYPDYYGIARPTHA
jgi:Kdo2-lipid IVA lauroyltransferase/acyltransferase